MSNSQKTRRRKGERKDGRIQVILDIGKGPGGKRLRKSFYGATRKEAEQKRDEYIQLKNTGYLPSLDADTVDWWVKRFEADYGIKEADRSYKNNLIKSIGNMKLSEVRHMHLVSALSKYEGKSKSGATKYRMLIRRIFNAAYKNKLIIDNPAVELPLPNNLTEGTHRALDQWEINAIITFWNKHHTLLSLADR